MQTNKTLVLTALLTGAMLLTNCGGNKEEAEKKEAEKKELKNEENVSPGNAINAFQEMAKQAEESQKNGPVETVDFRLLKELLPATADGLPRKEASGEKTGTMGFKISTANARYANADNSKTVDISVVDAGGSSALMGMAAWSMIDMDKETENGYEKTGSMGDYKTYEKYDNAGKDGEIAVLVAKRFVVTAKGNGISMDALKAALNEVDMSKLAEMK